MIRLNIKNDRRTQLRSIYIYTFVNNANTIFEYLIIFYKQIYVKSIVNPIYLTNIC